MDKITNTITKILEKVLTVLMAVIVIDVTWQIFTRFVLRDPSSFSEELAGFLLIWIGLLGASYALYTRAHLGIDILTHKLTGLKRKISEITIYVIVLIFSFFVLVIGGFKLVFLTLTLNQISPALGIAMGYVYIVLPLTGLLMIYYSIVFILKALRDKEYMPEDSTVKSFE
jgi:TRAP-type C4-dicarboxylate transport system permease small subunit